MERTVVLEDAQSTDVECVKVFYSKEIEGQINYLLEKCREKKIAAEDQGTRIGIYSKKKVANFAEVIRESYLYEEMPEPVMKGNSLTCRRDHTILGVLIKKEDKILAVCTEKHFRELKFFVYVKQVPRFQVSKIFNSHREMMEYLNEEERIFV